MIKISSLPQYSLILAGAAAVVTVYVPNNGGTGLMLPYNDLLLIFLGALLLLGLPVLRYASRENPALKGYVVGCLLLSLPLLWSDGNWLQTGALNHIATLLAALWGYILLSRMAFTPLVRRRGLQLILILAVLQALLGAVQTFFPALAHAWLEYDWLRNGGRPGGIFQQPNLLGSFMATGIGCGTWLYLNASRGRNRALYLAALLGCTFILGVNQSRTGLYGAVAIVCLLLAVIKTEKNHYKGWLVISTVCAIIAAKVTVHHTLYVPEFWAENAEFNLKSILRSYGGSNSERISILKNSIGMIMAHPLVGWGYGSFEHAFNHFAQNYQPFPSMARIFHPHNELVYTWIEGGIVAVVGLVVMFASWLKQIWPLRGAQLGAALLPLPLLMHTQLEYPFYQSLPHLAIFVLLLRMSWVDEQRSITAPRKWVKLTQVSVTAMFTLCLGSAALVAGLRLTGYERTQFADMPVDQPLLLKTQGSRAEFDALMGLLMRFNRTRDTALLNEFSQGAKPYLSIHNDPNISRYQLLINGVLQHKG